MKFAFRTLGCKVNQYETEAMEELFLQRGYERAEDPDACDIYIVNTCTVTHLSDAKCRQQINRIKKKNPEAIVAVVGCYAQVDPEAVERMEHVDVILGTKGRAQIVDYIEAIQKERTRIVDVRNLDEERVFDDLEIHTEQDKTRAHVKIQEGCDMFCTYCIIPYARGHIVSRPMESILREVRSLVEHGFKEIVLTGIHVASYGKEKGAQGDLIDVIEAISTISGLSRIRLSSIEPRWVTPEKLGRLRSIDAFCPHFHLSLQSGSDAVLRRMNRKYDRALYEQKVNEIRTFFPDAGLTTDIIVGFPGETEKDFQDTIDFCNTIGFSRIHIFPYSPRVGTPAASYPNPVDAKTKAERKHQLAEHEERLRLAFMQEQVGTTRRVLIEEGNGKEQLEGYTESYARVAVPYDARWMNQVCAVRILGIDGEILRGEVESVLE